MWEYKIVDSTEAEKAGFLKERTTKQVEDYLNKLGAKGWEIVDLDFQFASGGGPTRFYGLAKRERT